MPARMTCIVGDITTLTVDAIVNAANTSVLGGGGVDGAIHRAAGPGLLEECKRLPQVAPRIRCHPGAAVVTSGHDLPARHIIHTVGPVWSGGSDGERETLASCYRECLRLAEALRVRSIAFPAISTGAYRFPLVAAATIAVRTVAASSRESRLDLDVIFCCYDDHAAEVYRELLERSGDELVDATDL